MSRSHCPACGTHTTAATCPACGELRVRAAYQARERGRQWPVWPALVLMALVGALAAVAWAASVAP